MLDTFLTIAPAVPRGTQEAARACACKDRASGCAGPGGPFRRLLGYCTSVHGIIGSSPGRDTVQAFRTARSVPRNRIAFARTIGGLQSRAVGRGYRTPLVGRPRHTGAQRVGQDPCHGGRSARMGAAMQGPCQRRRAAAPPGRAGGGDSPPERRNISAGVGFGLVRGCPLTRQARRPPPPPLRAAGDPVAGGAPPNGTPSRKYGAGGLPTVVHCLTLIWRRCSRVEHSP